MQNNHDISVVLPVFNGCLHLEASINSVLEQDFSLELIVVDDGSTDATADICQSFGERIKYIHQENAGVAKARNTGIKAARAPFLAFIDSDDIWPNGKLSTAWETMHAHQNAAIVMGAIQMFTEEQPAAAPANTSERRLIGNPFYSLVFGSALIRRDLFESVGMTNESMTISSDFEWFVRANEQTLRIFYGEVSLWYRYRSGSLTFGKGMDERKILKIISESLQRRRSAGQID